MEQKRLSIAEYSEIEKINRCELPNRFLKHIAPITFKANSFCIDIEKEQELVRYNR